MPAHRNGGAGTDDSDEGIEAAHRAGMTATDVRLVYRPAWRFGFQMGGEKST
jgi:beta-phosphoglucomutase-like phosphatase (HAD superfamily)